MSHEILWCTPGSRGTASAIIEAARRASPRSNMNLVEIGPGKVRIVARAPWWSKLLGTKRVRMRVARAVDEVRPAFVEVEVVVL